MKKLSKRRLLLISITSTIIILTAWWGLTAIQIVPAVLLPSPERVLHSFFDLLNFGYNGISLWSHYVTTVSRLFIAVILAVLLGVPVGLLSGYSAKLGAVIDPIIQFIRPIPPLAYYTLLILWFGIGEVSKITLLFLAALPPIYIAAYDAVHRVNEEYIQSAASLGASQQQIFLKIILPAAIPGIFTGLRSASGVAYTTIVSAEMIASSKGVGWMIIDASHYLKSDVMFVGIIILGLTGMLIDWLLKLTERRFVHWSGKQ